MRGVALTPLAGWMLMASVAVGGEGDASTLRPVAAAGIRLYRAAVAPARPGLCPMTPSCSEYGRQAFATRPAAEAFLMTADRLLRCGADHGRYDTVRTPDGRRLFDPPGAPATLHRPRRSFFYRLDDAEEPLCEGDGARSFRFARKLHDDGHHTAAAIEYMRVAADFPSSPSTPIARFSLALVHREAGDPAEAFRLAVRLVDDESLPTSVRDEARLLAIGTLLSGGEVATARERADALVVAAGASGVRDRALLLSAIGSAWMRDWPTTEKTSAPLRSAAETRLDAARLDTLCAEARHERRLDPGKATVLAIVPGGGYLYTGHKRSAVTAFLVNALFGWAAYESFQRGNPGAGTALALVGSTWYAGSIYGARAAALRGNARADDAFHHRLEATFGF